jgi:hypothetical protein
MGIISKVVMPGLVPGIHVLALLEREKTWMAGTKPGHDERTSRFQLVGNSLKMLAAFSVRL